MLWRTFASFPTLSAGQAAGNEEGERDRDGRCQNHRACHPHKYYIRGTYIHAETEINNYEVKSIFPLG